MIIAVDFDGTIVEHSYPAIGKVSFPDFSRRFSVSLAKSIDTFGEVLLKGFTQS